MQRAKSLIYHGDKRRPRRKLFDVPARNLTERDIARLTDEQYVNATGGEHPLYAAPKEHKAQKEEKATDDKAADKTPAKDAEKPAD